MQIDIHQKILSLMERTFAVSVTRAQQIELYLRVVRHFTVVAALLNTLLHLLALEVEHRVQPAGNHLQST